VVEKKFYNSILLNKYPYFFKYLYKEAKKKYNRYCEESEITCHQRFKMSLKKLRELERLSPEQKQFIKNYYKYMPLTYSDSPMNMLCRYIESINFEINKKIKSLDNKNIIEYYQNDKHPYSKEQYEEIIDVLKNHVNGIKFDKLLPDDKDDDFDFDEDKMREYKVDNDTLQKNINKICSDVYLVTNVLINYFYNEKPSANKDILWSTYGKYIYKNVKEKVLENSKFPFPDKNGDIKYLGTNFSLKEINVDEL
jgi:hypothetical protein